MQVKIALEGTSAEEASAQLTKIDGIEAKTESPKEPETKELIALATIVTIFGLVKTALEIAKAIKDLFEKKKAADSTLKGVMQLPDGTRLDLENATERDIERALRALPKRDA